MSTPAPESNFFAEKAGLLFECSIPAAELNRRVNQELDGWNKYNEGHKLKALVDVSSESGGTYHTIATNWKYTDSSGSYPIVLARQVDLLKKSSDTTHAQKDGAELQTGWLRRILGKKPDTKQVAAHDPEPTVSYSAYMGIVRGKLFLPFASFVTKVTEDGCSYVQLGSEVSSDTVISTRLDDESDRLDLIQALGRVQTGYEVSYKPKKTPPKLVSTLIASAERQAEKPFAAMLVRSFKQQLQGRLQTDGVDMWCSYPVHEGFSSDTFKHIPLGPSFTVLDSTLARLTGARNLTTGSFHFGILLRESVFYPLLNILGDQSVDAPYADNIGLEQLKKINALVSNTYSWPGESEKHKDVDYAVLIDEHLNLPRLHKFGALALEEVVGKNTAKKLAASHREKEKLELADKLNALRFIKQTQQHARGTAPDSVNAPRDQTVSNEVIVAGNERIRKLLGLRAEQMVRLAQEFGLNNVLPLVKPLSAAQEKLIENIALMACLSQNHEGTIKNLKIGRVVGDMLFRAAFSKEGSTFSIHLDSRPDAMPNERLRPNATVVIDALTGTAVADEAIEDLVSILNRLQPSSSSA